MKRPFKDISNKAKLDMTKEVFLSWVKRIYEHQNWSEQGYTTSLELKQ